MRWGDGGSREREQKRHSKMNRNKQGHGSGSGNGSGGRSAVVESGGVVDVWATNLQSQFLVIEQLIKDYPFVAMDTEFPGVVARPIGTFKTANDYNYQTLRCNVDLLSIIQLGICFTDAQGNPPPAGLGASTFQFHFKFSLENDMYAQDSIDLLTHSGIDFAKHNEIGIDPEEFGDIMTSSGLVLLDKVKWISFHSGYDFGYLLKVLTSGQLPPDENNFFDLLRLYFPTIYDIKYLMKSCKSLKGGLQDVADDLQIKRVGPQHQAGSDSMLTSMTFFKMRHIFFEDNIDDGKFRGFLYGLNHVKRSPER